MRDADRGRAYYIVLARNCGLAKGAAATTAAIRGRGMHRRPPKPTPEPRLVDEADEDEDEVNDGRDDHHREMTELWSEGQVAQSGAAPR